MRFIAPVLCLLLTFLALPLRAADRLDAVPRVAVVVAFEHHMHFYGGGGYPKAPFGPSLHAQIVAIADTFDAVFGKRSYRDRYDVLQAIEILQSDRGWLYNPELADEFCRFITAQLDQSDAAGLAAEPAVS